MVLSTRSQTSSGRIQSRPPQHKTTRPLSTHWVIINLTDLAGLNRELIETAIIVVIEPVAPLTRLITLSGISNGCGATSWASTTTDASSARPSRPAASSAQGWPTTSPQPSPFGRRVQDQPLRFERSVRRQPHRKMKVSLAPEGN